MSTYTKIIDLRKKIQEEFGPVLDAISKIKSGILVGFNLANYKNVQDIRPGYKIINGKINKTPTIVFLVDKKMDKKELTPAETIPASINNLPTDVTTISPFEKARKANKDIMEGMMPGTVVSDSKYLLDSSDYESIGLLPAEAGFIPKIGYVPPTDVQLIEVTEAMSVICHVSPEEGWHQLKSFIGNVTTDFRLGMYDYSAPHINDALVEMAKNVSTINIVYDGKAPAGIGKQGVKKPDISEDNINDNIKAKNNKFDYVKAKLGKNGLFANAYHIKVCVKDKEAFWLSSGNWQSSNQPNFESNDPEVTQYTMPFSKALQKYNREWHVIICNKTLANIYCKFLEYDQQQSAQLDESFMNAPVLPVLDSEQLLPDAELESLVDTKGLKEFAAETFDFDDTNPLRIQPVLTPDNYIPIIRPLIEAAKSRIFFQNQYITVGKQMTDNYFDLLNALKTKCDDSNIDFRIILRNEGDVRLMLENLIAFGFDQSKIKIQNNCHNKGIIIDDGILILGSHNWSNSGVEFNRDATLVIYSSNIRAYYQKVYEFDWQHLSINKVPEDTVANRNSGSEEGFCGLPIYTNQRSTN